MQLQEEAVCERSEYVGKRLLLAKSSNGDNNHNGSNNNTDGDKDLDQLTSAFTLDEFLHRFASLCKTGTIKYFDKDHEVCFSLNCFLLLF